MFMTGSQIEEWNSLFAQLSLLFLLSEVALASGESYKCWRKLSDLILPDKVSRAVCANHKRLNERVLPCLGEPHSLLTSLMGRKALIGRIV